ncbi:MAG: aminotransferase class V-fold PLP-dependent enzyme [Pseudomonadota bacterium]|nr:aminotransferase class V-fold PLP-dependent enzyme [Pseudomonadota bacterium]
MIYLDNAATSFPKPPEVLAAMTHYATAVGASPGRSGHQPAANAGRLIFQAREQTAKLFNINNSSRIIFTKNVTEALNLTIFGLVKPGDRILTTAMEHNSVIRPLRYLEQEGRITLDIIPATPTGEPDLEYLKQQLRKHSFQLAVLNHGSNITGNIFPLAETIPRLKAEGITVIVDGAQTAGAVPIDLKTLDCDIFCFTGHKSLLGPQGTGGFVPREGLKPLPLTRGGTGSRSEAEYQPDFLPDYYESGTPNTIGLAGLAAALKFINQTTVEEIHRHERKLTRKLWQGLATITGLRLYDPGADQDRLPVISFTMDKLTPAEISFKLDREDEIMVRVGLHCAPLAHKTIGTFPQGTVRLAPGYFNTDREMETVIKTIEKMAAHSPT